MNQNPEKPLVTFSFMAEEDNYILSDHRFMQYPCIPGVAFLDIVYRALLSAKQLNFPEQMDISDIEIRNMVFLKPVIIDKVKRIKILVKVFDQGFLAHNGKLFIRGREETGEDVFQCEAYHAKGDNIIEEISIQPEYLIANAKKTFDLDEVYEITKLHNIDHFDFMKLRGTAYLGEDYVLSKINMGEHAQKYIDFFALHPSILDGATVTVGPLYATNEKYFHLKGRAFLPFCVKQFFAYKEFKASEYYIYVNTEGSHFAEGGIFYDDIKIYGLDGKLWAIYRQFGTKDIRLNSQPDDVSQKSEADLWVSAANAEESDTNNIEKNIKENVTDLISRLLSKLLEKEISREDADKKFFDLGLDSSNLLQLSKTMEDTLGIRLYSTILFEYPTLNKIVGYLMEEFNASLESFFKMQAYPELPKDVKKEAVPDEPSLWSMLNTLEWVEYTYSNEDKNDKKVQNSRYNCQKCLIVCTDTLSKYADLFKEKIQSKKVFKLVLSNRKSSKSSDCYYVHYRDKSGVEEALNDIGQLDAIFFLNGLDTYTLSGNDLTKDYAKAESKGIMTLFNIIKSLQHNKCLNELKSIVCVTNSVYKMSGETAALPFYAALHGFLRSLSKEYRHINFAVFDIDITEIDIQNKDFKENLDYVLSLITGLKDTNGEEIFIRGQKTYVRRPQKINLERNLSSSKFKNNGVYVIIGGSGGLGQAVSLYLAEKYQARLVWIGRSPLSSVIKEAKEVIKKVGGQLVYKQLDITDQNAVDEKFIEIEKDLGAINGVIHSALVLDDRLFHNMTAQSMQNVLAPKTKGLIALYRSLKHKELDFVLFFSSIQTFLGNIGQSNYAAASAFEDAFALFMRDMVSYDIRIINWGLWGDVGIAAGSDAYNKMIRDSGVIPITVKEGIPLIESVLSCTIDQVCTINFKDSVLKEYGLLSEAKDQNRDLAYNGIDAPATGINIKILNIEENYPSKRFLHYWLDLKKGAAMNNQRVYLERGYAYFYNKNAGRLRHFLICGEKGKQTEVVTWGQGTPVLLVNGFGLTASQWYYQIKELRDHQFICIHIPGIGLSVGECDVDFETIADILAEALNAMGISEKISVVGTSFGGLVAQTFAARHSERVGSLVLVCSSSEIKINFERNSLSGYIEADFKNVGNEEDLHFILDSEMINAEAAKYAEYSEKGFSTVELARQVQCKTLLISGDRDTVFSRQETQKLKDLLPNAKEIVIAGGGHAPYITHYKMFNKILADYLRDTDIEAI